MPDLESKHGVNATTVGVTQRTDAKAKKDKTKEDMLFYFYLTGCDFIVFTLKATPV